MEYGKEDVLKALSTVYDPDLKKDLVSLQMVRDIEVFSDVVKFTVVLTTPACPLKEIIRKDCEKAIHEKISKDLQIQINMISEVTSVRDNSDLLNNIKNVIAIASGKGGVGKSTVAANLAVSLALDGAKVGLIDADIFGPSVPIMFNCENEKPGVKKVNGKNLIIPLQQYGVKIISIGFLAPADNAVVWRGPMASSALRQFINDTDWGELDYLLVDLPPGTSDIHLTMVQTLPVTGAVIVTTPQKVAIADARKGLAMFKQPQINVPVLGIVENMAYFTPPENPDKKYFIFGENGGSNLSKKQNVPFLGQLPIMQEIRESGDSGYPVAMKEDNKGAFRELARELARQVAIRNAAMEKTKQVEVN